MAWDKRDEHCFTFECDSCGADVIELKADTITPKPGQSNFGRCWSHLQGLGWRSFKRAGRDWTYHCPKCGPEAEMQFREYRRQESERDRTKARNESSS